MKLIFVIGITAAGKTHSIDTNYRGKDVEVLNVYDYQQRAYDEAGYGDWAPLGAEFECLMTANEELLNDSIELLKQGKDVVVEHTLYKAKRRITYIDAIRQAVDAEIEFYVITPGEALWKENVKKRELTHFYERTYDEAAQDMEFPNPAEGIDKIYTVTGNDIRLRMDAPTPDILAPARKEIEEERIRLQERKEKKKKRAELLESMKTRPFWHYCEVCGKKEFITADEAHEKGWDYPPKIGAFGMLGPRTCGNCGMKDTLFFKVNSSGRLPIVIEKALSPEELVTWRRIKAEPESLLEERKQAHDNTER